MKLLKSAVITAIILFGFNAPAKNSCVEVLASGAPSGAQVRSERDRESRIVRLLTHYFAANPLPENRTGRLDLIPNEGKVSLASEEFDELILSPLAQALAPERELLDLLTDQIHTKVKNAVFVILHEGRAVSVEFYNPRARPENPFSKSEYSGEVKAVPLNSEAGQELLRQARAAGLIDETIVNYYQPQSFTTFCGIASSCMVLSSMRSIPLSQDTLMRWNRHVKPEAIVKAQLGEDPGFQLGQLVQLLNSRHDRALAVFAQAPQAEGAAWLKQDIENSLAGQEQKLIVNFYGVALGTLTGGHFSPVAAFVPESNMVLILDTAAHKNEPFWIPLADLYHAMTKMDSGSGQPRGWIRVSKPKLRR
jgi:hypothetical protein